MKIHETSEAATFLLVENESRSFEGGRSSSPAPLVLALDEGTFALPRGALDAVMARFGAPLDPRERLIDVDVLELGDGRLRHVRHRGFYDVIARDYLVLERPGTEPLCALATTVAGALAHLGRAHRERR